MEGSGNGREHHTHYTVVRSFRFPRLQTDRQTDTHTHTHTHTHTYGRTLRCVRSPSFELSTHECTRTSSHRSVARGTAVGDGTTAGAAQRPTGGYHFPSAQRLCPGSDDKFA